MFLYNMSTKNIRFIQIIMVSSILIAIYHQNWFPIGQFQKHVLQKCNYFSYLLYGQHQGKKRTISTKNIRTHLLLYLIQLKVLHNGKLVIHHGIQINISYHIIRFRLLVFLPGLRMIQFNFQLLQYIQ